MTNYRDIEKKADNNLDFFCERRGRYGTLRSAAAFKDAGVCSKLVQTKT